jgi:ABC-2 type transport system ATP-binding protein
MSSGPPLAIEARGVQKSFSIPVDRQTTIKERVLRPKTWLRGEARYLDALRGISFDVARGEFFGVIGRNGCGKSTLLKLLASIYELDEGSIRVGGRLAPFIELGVGLNPELQAHDNIVLNGVMMGLSPAEARSRCDAVIDYAELRDYVDLKLKNYSFGMQVRLAFSTMLEVDADVLLVDEVLAVGDLAFQEKCIASLREIRRRGTTIVFVTHDMEAVQSHCDRAMLIEDGLIEAIGDPDSVTERFVEVILPTASSSADDDRHASGGAFVTAAWLSDRGGSTVRSVAGGEPVTINLTIRAREQVTGLRLMLELVSQPGGVRIAAFPVGDDGEIPPLGAGEEITVRVLLEENSLEPGDYGWSYALDLPAADRTLDRSVEPLRLRIPGTGSGRGLVRFGHRVTVDRGMAEKP